MFNVIQVFRGPWLVLAQTGTQVTESEVTSLPDMSSWIQLIQVGGVALAMLVVILLALWRFFAWAGKKFDQMALPVIERHISLIAKLEASLESIQRVQTEQLRAQAEQLEMMRRMRCEYDRSKSA